MKTRHLQIIAATTLLSALLWLSVNMNNHYQTTVSVPLILSDTPAGLALQTPMPRELQLSFRGEGWQLAAYLWRSDFQYRIDLGNSPHVQKVVTIRDVLREMTIPPGVELVDMKPESLFIAFEPYVEKKVRVYFNTSMSFAEGYGLSGPPSVRPESVTIGGAASLLTTIEGWRTRHSTFENLKAPVETEVPLDESTPFLLTVSPGTVRVTVNVQPFAEKTFNGVPIEVRSVPEDREVILIPPKIDIVVRGGIDRLATAAATDCRAYIDYKTIQEDTTRILPPEIELPVGITLMSKTPDRVQYFIRRRLR